MTLDEYAQQCGLTVKRIRAIASAHGLKLRSELSPYHIERLDTLVSDYHEQNDERQRWQERGREEYSDGRGAGTVGRKLGSVYFADCY